MKSAIERAYEDLSVREPLFAQGLDKEKIVAQMIELYQTMSFSLDGKAATRASQKYRAFEQLLQELVGEDEAERIKRRIARGPKSRMALAKGLR